MSETDAELVKRLDGMLAIFEGEVAAGVANGYRAEMWDNDCAELPYKDLRIIRDRLEALEHIAKHGLAKYTPEHTWAEWVADQKSRLEALQAQTKSPSVSVEELARVAYTAIAFDMDAALAQEADDPTSVPVWESISARARHTWLRMAQAVLSHLRSAQTNIQNMNSGDAAQPRSGSAIGCADADRKPPRDPSARCPSCNEVVLYTDYYDQCYGCGRNIAR